MFYQQQTNTREPVLITGCSSGLGHALALSFVKAGHPTYASARRLDSIRDLENSGCHILELDVTLPESIDQAVLQIEKEHVHVGILINNAAIGIMTPIETIEIDNVRKQYETNVFGLLSVTQKVIPAMRKNGKGKIINIGSSGGEFTTPGGGVYQATKYALDSMNDAMRMEFKSFGIDVILIEPGAISSKFASNGDVLGTSEGHYKELMRGISKVSHAAIEPNAWGTWSPTKLAAFIYKVSMSSRPKTRYRPGIVAKSLIFLKRWLPARLWDTMFMSSLTKQGK